MTAQRIETTYADLRPTDLVIDKAGNAWPIKEVEVDGSQVRFVLCDPVTKVQRYGIVKDGSDPVTVSRVPSHADEAAKLEAEFPVMRHASEMPEIDLSDDAPPFSEQLAALKAAKLEADFPKSTAPVGAGVSPTVSATTETPQELTTETTGVTTTSEATEPTPSDTFATMEEAVAAVEEIGGTVEAEVTAEEVDAANAATEDAPISLPPFAGMTPLERRSHLYLLHGIYATDVRSNDELVDMHQQAHAGAVVSKTVPHVHEVAS